MNNYNFSNRWLSSSPSTWSECILFRFCLLHSFILLTLIFFKGNRGPRASPAQGKVRVRQWPLLLVPVLHGHRVRPSDPGRELVRAAGDRLHVRRVGHVHHCTRFIKMLFLQFYFRFYMYFLSFISCHQQI
jgi:hypothetical protein